MIPRESYTCAFWDFSDVPSSTQQFRAIPLEAVPCDTSGPHAL